ncbi:hypothetical protein [Lyngbya aestuarii]|uniref:hypothetical protein n=1 Tax=Lyngbya aestuarii TaxID=118322 RepID=UPI00403E158A
MISEEELVKEFTTVVERFYPKAGELLSYCSVKIIKYYCGRPRRLMRYIGIYCPQSILNTVEAQKDVFREVAQHLGLLEVVCLNATRLVRDPMSKLKEEDPRLWLELHWIASQGSEP